MDLSPHSNEELVVTLANQCADKYRRLVERPWAFLLQSFIGGAMVGFGAILALSVSAGVPWPGIANLLMGLMFGFSLVIILVSGNSLITADMVIGIIGIFHRRLTWRQYGWFILVSYLGNAVGCFSVCVLVYIGGSNYITEPWLLRAHQIAVAKTGMTDLQTFAMGCFCTWLLQTGVILFFKARTDIGKIGMAYYGPLAFVAGMTEHCIANIGFLALPILEQPLYTQVLHTPLAASGPAAYLHWGFVRYGWAHNQLFTLMGNFIGGTVLVGLTLHFISDPARVMALYRRSWAKARQLASVRS